jgi:hypothetical protein
MSRELVERQARYLAADNFKAEPDIEKVYWLPDDGEVRLVELTPQIPEADNGMLQPFHFNPSPEDGLPSPSTMAPNQPLEVRRLALPKRWGTWDDAVQIEQGGDAE